MSGASRRDFMKYSSLAALAGLAASHGVPAIAATGTQRGSNASISLDEYRNNIAEARAAIDNSAFRDRVFIVDLSQARSMPELIQQIEAQARQTVEGNKDLNATDKEGTVKSHVAWIASYAKGDMKNVRARAFPNQRNPASANYLAAVFPQLPQDVIKSRMEDVQVIFTGSNNDALTVSPSSSFLEKLDNRFSHKHTLWHEIGHSLLGAEVERGETQLCADKRQESAADVFAVLCQAQRQQPDIRSQCERYSDLRNIEIITHAMSGDKRTNHDTSPALDAVFKDLPALARDPNFARASLSDLIKMADKYARDFIRQDYPHLYVNNGLSAEESLKRTQEVDMNIDMAAGIAYGACYLNHPRAIDALVTQKDERFLDHWQKNALKIDATQAAFLMRLSASVTRYTGNPRNLFAQTVEKLKSIKRDVFTEADKRTDAKAASTEPKQPERRSQSRLGDMFSRVLMGNRPSQG